MSPPILFVGPALKEHHFSRAVVRNDQRRPWTPRDVFAFHFRPGKLKTGELGRR